MFLPARNGEVVGCGIEQLDAAIARCGKDLVLVDFRPGQIVERILCGESGSQMNISPQARGIRTVRADSKHLRFHRHDPIGSEL